MDPLSITTGVLCLSEVCLKVGTGLRKLKQNIKEAKGRIEGLLSDVNGLRNVLQLMEVTVDDLEDHNIFQTTGHIGVLWTNLNQSLKDGESMLGEIDKLLNAVNKEVAVLDSARRYLRFQDASDQLIDYRQHVQTFSDTIQFSVQTITLYVHQFLLSCLDFGLMSNRWNSVSIKDDTSRIGPKVDAVNTRLQELEANLGIKFMALSQLVSGPLDNDRQAALQRLEATVRSAATVVSAASTLFGDDPNRGEVDENSFHDPELSPDLQNEIGHWIQAQFGVTSFEPAIYTGIAVEASPVEKIGSILQDGNQLNTPTHHDRSSSGQSIGSRPRSRENELLQPPPSSSSSLNTGQTTSAFKFFESTNYTDNTNESSLRQRRSWMWRPSLSSKRNLAPTVCSSSLKVVEPIAKIDDLASRSAFDSLGAETQHKLMDRAKNRKTYRRVPLPATQRETSRKIVVVGDGSCGKTSNLM